MLGSVKCQISYRTLAVVVAATRIAYLSANSPPKHPIHSTPPQLQQSLPSPYPRYLHPFLPSQITRNLPENFDRNLLLHFYHHLLTQKMPQLNAADALSHLNTYENRDGLSVQALMDSKTRGGLTYQDFLVLPGHINFDSASVSLKTKVSRNIELSAPFVSSPMDSVTETKMATYMALMGGIGILHHNNTAEEQADMVRQVKKFENGFITDPICLKPTAKVSDVLDIKDKLGFGGIPITESGTLHSKLLGIVTARDIQFQNLDSEVKEVMTTELVTGNSGITLEEANKILRVSKKGKLPIVDKNGELTALLARSDLLKNLNFPLASKHPETKQLYCGASIGTRDADKERLRLLVEAGLDVVVLDSSQGNSIYQINMLKWIKDNFKNIDVIAGNVVTREQAAQLISAGADGLRIGMGSGGCRFIHIDGLTRPRLHLYHPGSHGCWSSSRYCCLRRCRVRQPIRCPMYRRRWYWQRRPHRQGSLLGCLRCYDGWYVGRYNRVPW